MNEFNLKKEIERVKNIIEKVRNPLSQVKLVCVFDGISDDTKVLGERDRIKQVLLGCIQSCLLKVQRGNVTITAKYIEEKEVLKISVESAGNTALQG